MIITRSKVDADVTTKENSNDRERLYASLLFSVAVALLYVPVIIDTAGTWARNDNYSHGFLVIPCSLFLLWIQRARIKQAQLAPTIWGAVPLVIGLLMQIMGYIVRIKYVAMWSLVFTLTGGVLLLFGQEVWRMCRFPIFFILFAAPFSNSYLYRLTSVLQTISTVGSTSFMSSLGFTVLRHGNVIELPGAILEIANACSGFHSIVSMLAFTCCYAYLFAENNFKRAILVFSTFPIALTANVLRISLLIVAATYGGMNGYHAFHDPAAIAEIIVDFLVVMYLGKVLGCDSLRFAI
jgi:exosortase